MSARFDRGPGWGFVGDALVALVGADASVAVIERFSALSRETPVSPSQVVEMLSQVGIGSLPSLAIVLLDADGFHLLVRGATRLAVANGDDVELLAAPRAASWSEDFRTEVTGFVLDFDDRGGIEIAFDDPSYWCDRGVVPASRLVVAAQHFEGRSIVAPQAPTVGSTAQPLLAVVPPVVDERAADDGLEPSYLRRLIEETRDRESGSTDTVRAGDESNDPDAAEDAAAHLAEVPVVAILAESSERAGHTLPFDDLGETIGAVVGGLTDASAPPAPTVPTPVVSDALGHGLISAVPGSAAPPSPPRPPLPPPARGERFEPMGDHDGNTVTVETLRAARESIDAGSAGPTVQAVHCPAVHPNPPHAERCRTCGVPIDDHTVTVITRPVLGELRFDNGDTYPMDRPMLIGRRPSSARDTLVDGEAARLVTVQDPQNVLSKVHLEVRIADWQVLIVDRNSTNHTIVTLPDRSPTQIHPGDAIQIVPGTLIDLGGAARARYEIAV